MPLASSGAWLSSGRQASHLLSHGGTTNIASNTKHQARGIHIPRPAPTQPSSTTQRLLRSTRGLFHAFVGHLTTPGTLNGRIPSSASRGLHGITRPQTIQQGWSPGMRYALSRPMGAPKLPKVPVVPRGVTQVGLGTARNFSTGRPIFQDLVQNVPIAGRAAYEVDWDIGQQMKEERKLAVGKQQKKAHKAESHNVEKVHLHDAAASAISSAKGHEEEINHYFPPAPVPAVTTQLLIPLAPTPTSRLPLAANPPSVSSKHPLLPLSVLSNIHSDHSTHSLRVSTLFGRLDNADVWSRGASCDVYGSFRGEASVLRVRFVGWTEKEVRAVVGESAKGWCVLEEEATADEEAKDMQEVDDALSDMDLESGTVSVSDFEMERNPFEDAGHSTSSIDPAQSFVLPTLDFSATFPVSPQSTSLHNSPFGSPGFDDAMDVWSDSDSLSDFGSFSDGSLEYGIGGESASFVEPPSVSMSRVSSSWMGFSSAFSDRVNDEGPRESMF